MSIVFNFFSFQAVTTYLYTAITQNCFGLQRCYNPFWKFWNKQKQGEKSSKWTKLVSQIKKLLRDSSFYFYHKFLPCILKLQYLKIVLTSRNAIACYCPFWKPQIRDYHGIFFRIHQDWHRWVSMPAPFFDSPFIYHYICILLVQVLYTYLLKDLYCKEQA